MDYLIGITGQTATVIVVAAVLLLVMARALKNIQLSELFESTGSGKVSHTKFWANCAYFICTLSFAYMNLKTPPPDYLVEIWMVYLTAVAGNASVSKFLSLKYKQPPPDLEETDENEKG